MGRVIKTGTATSDRNKIMRAILLTLRALALKAQPDDEALDMTAFLVLSLDEIENSVDKTVAAWEKRDYWIKADKFRIEWEWAGILSRKLRQAIGEEDWGEIAVLATKVLAKCDKVSLSSRNNLGKPWQGAWAVLQGQKSKI